jgi:hypothetical protein
LEVNDLNILVGEVDNLDWMNSIVIFHISLSNESRVIIVSYVVMMCEKKRRISF